MRKINWSVAREGLFYLIEALAILASAVSVAIGLLA